MGALLENIILGKQYAAIEFFSLSRQEKIAFLLVQKKRDELLIAETHIYNDIKELGQKKAKLPVALIINNEQVLQKEVQGTDANDKKLLHKAFPNLQSDDFYYEIWRRESSSVIAICRKLYVEELLSGVNQYFKIATTSLGICSIATLSGFELPKELSTNTQTIAFETQESILINIIPSFKKYIINSLELPNTHLLTFCGILNILLPSLTTGSITDLNTTLDETFKQKVFFEKGLKAVIFVLLLLLLVNFFLFSFYFKKANEMAETASLNKAGIENISLINKRLKDKEQRLERFGNNTASASSEIINDMVKNMPPSLLLSEMTYHPIEGKLKEGEPLKVSDSLVSISGTSISNMAFTSWIEELEKLNRINNVTIASFGKDANGSTVFTISISIEK